MLLRFRKSHYGLKLSSHIGFSTFQDLMIAIGFVASVVDGSLFVLYSMDQDLVASVVLCVTDLLIISNEVVLGRSSTRSKRGSGCMISRVSHSISV